MFAIALSGMAGKFRGRHGKDQPSTAGIDGGKAKHVPEKGPVGLGVACVDDGMHACNHGHLHRCGSVARSLVANCGHCANRICFDANSLNSGSGLIGPDPTLTEVTCSRRRSDRMAPSGHIEASSRMSSSPVCGPSNTVLRCVSYRIEVWEAAWR